MKFVIRHSLSTRSRSEFETYPAVNNTSGCWGGGRRILLSMNFTVQYNSSSTVSHTQQLHNNIAHSDTRTGGSEGSSRHTIAHTDTHVQTAPTVYMSRADDSQSHKSFDWRSARTQVFRWAAAVEKFKPHPT